MTARFKHPFQNLPFPIVVSLIDGTPETEIKNMKDAGVAVIELRIDRFSSMEAGHVLEEIFRFKDFLTIATLRSEREGGSWPYGEAERLKYYQTILPHVHAVDVEIGAKATAQGVVQAAHKLRKTCLLSFHDFHKTPALAVLKTVVSKGKKLGGDIIKIASAVKNTEDLKTLTALTLLSTPKEPLITIGMAQAGMPSRLFFPFIGSLLTYTHAGEAMAPGQVHYETAADIFSRLQAE